jgi:hypothetical protein
MYDIISRMIKDVIMRDIGGTSRFVPCSLFVRVTVVWRTNLEVPPSACGSSRKGSVTMTGNWRP